MKDSVEIRKKNVALSSVFASLLLTILKLVVGILTGSIGIISEAAHSGLDLAAAFITYLAVRISGHPADITHHYGHGKAESFSALIETGLLLITAVWIIYEAVQRLIFGEAAIEVTWYAFGVMFISVAVDITRSSALYKVAKETNSQALEADALHFHIDIYSSLVVIAGLFFVMLGIPLADAIAAIGVAIFVVYASFHLGKRTMDVLMDKAPKEVTEQISVIINKTDGVVGIERLRVRPVVNSVFIDAIIFVGRKASIEQVDNITKSIEENIKKEIMGADLVIHTKPVAIEGETIIERIQTIAQNHGLGAHNINIYKAHDKKFVNFDLEVGNNDTLEKGHKTATNLENAIKKELGNDINIYIHIEPMKSSEVTPGQISSEETSEILKILNSFKKEIPQIKDVHNISIQSLEKKLFISLHCVFDKKISVEKAHQLSEEIMDRARKKIPNLDSIYVHPEPNSPKG